MNAILNVFSLKIPIKNYGRALNDFLILVRYVLSILCIAQFVV